MIIKLPSSLEDTVERRTVDVAPDDGERRLDGSFSPVKLATFCVELAFVNEEANAEAVEWLTLLLDTNDGWNDCAETGDCGLHNELVFSESYKRHEAGEIWVISWLFVVAATFVYVGEFDLGTSTVLWSGGVYEECSGDFGNPLDIPRVFVLDVTMVRKNIIFIQQHSVFYNKICSSTFELRTKLNDKICWMFMNFYMIERTFVTLRWTE